MEKVCSRCREIKKLDQFYKDRSRLDGHEHTCKVCKKSSRRKSGYQKKWKSNRRSAWITENGPCRHCGTWENLEVDHIDPTKKEYSVGQLWSRTKELREYELSKCQVLCKPCHIKKTIKDNGWLKKHNATGYSRGCRCDICLKDHNRVNNEWRWKTGRRKKRIKDGGERVARSQLPK